MRFRTFYDSPSFLIEAKNITFKELEKIINKTFEKYTLYKTNPKTDQYKLLSKNRVGDKDKFTKDLKKNKIKFQEKLTSTSSIPILIVQGDKEYRFFFKPLSGGMNETTINSTMTELVPAILFMKKSFRKIKNNKDMLKAILKFKIESLPVFVNSKDAASGRTLLNQAFDSSKFEEKMDNARAIADYLDDLNKSKKIKNVWWTYRAKPKGVPADSPADIVAGFTNGSMLGISLKAGGEKTKEPQLNTYVRPVKMFFDKKLDELRKTLWTKVYSKIPKLDKNEYMSNSRNMKTILLQFEKKNKKKYDELYDDALHIVRQSVIKDFGNEKMLKQFIKTKILHDTDMPVKVIKAIGRKWKEITDKDKLSDDLAIVDSIQVKAESSKQIFTIRLNIKDEPDIVMLFSVRTNKPQGSNKLHQVPNLAVKYNGLK